MSEEITLGFTKRGTTLEGRVAQLLRLMGYNVSRNEIIEGHEIDVYGEKEGKRIVIECKEFYTQLISRDLILIFATKVRDINPDEAWFVTISDFENSALELCKRYVIRGINGYDLEELEEQAIIKKGEFDFGSIPPEDRFIRLLNRRRIELSREKRRYEEIRKVVDQINSLRIQRIELPPYLFPTTEKDLEEKYIWLTDLEKTPKISEEGKITDMIVNIGGRPRIRGFKISKEKKISLAPFLALVFWIISIFLFYQRARFDMIIILQYFSPSFVLSIIVIYFRNKIVHKSIQIINRSIVDAEIGTRVLYFPRTSEPFVDDPWDLQSQKMFDLDVKLIDETYLGTSIDYVVEKSTWLIRGIRIQLNPEISKETGMGRSIIPIRNLEVSIQDRLPEIKVDALYVLSDKFFTERKRV